LYDLKIKDIAILEKLDVVKNCNYKGKSTVIASLFRPITNDIACP